MNDLHHVWVYLSALPLLHLALTLIAYQVGYWIYLKTNYHPLCNPVLFAVIALVSILLITKTDYKTYFDGAQFVHFLLGPATVALAVPLYRAYHHIRSSAWAITITIIIGSLTAIVSAVGVGWVFGATPQTLLSLAPKSVTTPIAMGISEQIGGLPSLTAVFVILTGIIGAVLSTWVLNLVRVYDIRARGLATGLVAHGIGTAHKLRINEISGAFAGLAMGVNGLATAILIPLLIRLMH